MFLIELHAHTAPASACAFVSVEEQLTALKAAGYDGVVLTNHHCLRGTGANTLDALLADYRLACKIGERIGLRVYFGAELRFEAHGINDYLVLGLTAEEYVALGEVLGMHPDTFYAIRPSHALVVQAHPFRDHIVVTDPKYLDGVEICNGNPRAVSRNELALAHGLATRADRPDFVLTAGGDIHREGDVRGTGVLFSRMPRDERELADMLRRGAPETVPVGVDKQPIGLQTKQ